MYPLEVRELARRRVAAGETTVAVAADLGVSQKAVWRWARGEFASDDSSSARCPLADGGPPAGPYSYLLGQYLGDGHLVTGSRVPTLRIYTCTDYPGIVDETCAAVLAVRGSEPARLRAAHTDRMIKIRSYWKHWPCLFPKHGPGMKHTRPIVLAEWQRAIVDEHPWPLIRGLIHSDGCRVINRVVVRGVTYRYPRYFFSNTSTDILAIFGAACDRVAVAWRRNLPNSISIAKREAVALMDEHVGPKC
ncbi:transcriptional regulator [Jatrophihabitans fulvus]